VIELLLLVSVLLVVLFLLMVVEDMTWHNSTDTCFCCVHVVT